MDQGMYPSWRYASGDRTCIVESIEEDEALGEGWYDSPAKIPDPDDDPAKEDASHIEALKAEAESLGIKVDARWGEKRLAAEIEKAKIT